MRGSIGDQGKYRIQRHLIRMAVSNLRRAKKDKYSSASEPTFIIHRGQRLTLGGVQEMLRHCDAQWYAYLERVVNNPKEQNPFEQ